MRAKHFHNVCRYGEKKTCSEGREYLLSGRGILHTSFPVVDGTNIKKKIASVTASELKKS